jgi:membrane-bound lytic murein transglycosylase B
MRGRQRGISAGMCALVLAMTATAAVGETSTVADNLAAINQLESTATVLEAEQVIVTDSLAAVASELATAQELVSREQAATDRADDRRQAEIERVAKARQTVRSLATAIYLGGAIASVDRIDGPADADIVDVYTEAVTDRWGIALRTVSESKTSLDAAADRQSESLATARAALDDLTTRQRELETRLTAIADEITTSRFLAAELRQRMVATSPSEVVPGTDIPVIALVAYQRAAAWVGAIVPSCAIAWFHVAAIGRVESNHGRFAGSQPLVDGRVLPPVRGIPLDGTRSLAIADTDLGVLDGDPIWDRALGPTQFIPGTWNGYASLFDLDGNADGVEDPDNIFDAARATAIYLCRHTTGPLTDPANARVAIYGYNPSDRYVEAAQAWMAYYGLLVVPDLTAVTLDSLPKLDIPAAVLALPPLAPADDPASLSPPNTDPIPSPDEPTLTSSPTTPVEASPTSTSPTEPPTTVSSAPSTTSTTATTAPATTTNEGATSSVAEVGP